jgi:hypothetical protein
VQGQGHLKHHTMPQKQIPRAMRPFVGLLEYKGQAIGKKTIYQVIATGDDFIVYSFRTADHRRGNFNHVTRGNIDRVFKEFAGEQRVTCTMMLSNPKIGRFFDRFSLLQTLYAMVAIKQAKIDHRSPKSNTLYFNFVSE